MSSHSNSCSHTQHVNVADWQAMCSRSRYIVASACHPGNQGTVMKRQTNVLKCASDCAVSPRWPDKLAKPVKMPVSMHQHRPGIDVEEMGTFEFRFVAGSNRGRFAITRSAAKKTAKPRQKSEKALHIFPVHPADGNGDVKMSRQLRDDYA